MPTWRETFKFARSYERMVFDGLCPCGCGKYVIRVDGERHAVGKRHYDKFMGMQKRKLERDESG